MNKFILIIFALLLPCAVAADIDERRSLGYFANRYRDIPPIDPQALRQAETKVLTARAAPYMSSILNMDPADDIQDEHHPNPEDLPEFKTASVPLPLPATLLLAGLSMLSFFSLRPRR